MLPLHTQKSLDQLTWNEVQKIHASLGLKATATTRTRRDYQRRIVEAQPQPVAEPEAIATPLTCETCPLGRHIDGNRYCCGLTDAVVRGNWEAKTDCYDAVAAQAETEIEVTEPAVETEAPIASEEIATVTYPQSAWPQPAWYIEMMTEIMEYQQSLPRAPKPSKLYTKLCKEMEVGDYLKTNYEVTRRRTQVVAGKETLPDGRIRFTLNCGISHREVFSQEVWLKDPIAQPEQTPAPKITATTNDEPPNQGDNVRGRVEAKALIAPAKTKLTNHPFRYRADIFQGQHSFSSATYGLCECDRCVPVAQLTITEHVTPRTVATTTDDAPPNRGDNGRSRVTSILPMPTVTIASIPHATKPKADNNFMTTFTRESERDCKFNDLAYLSQLKMEAQLAIEQTEIGSEQEAIAYAHLRSIEADIKYYGQPKPEPQSSPAIQQLEIQMKELKADVLSLFKITPFDPNILPVDTDELEQPAIKSEPEPEGTIHWTTPLLRGVIVGKKGATRQFYIRNNEIFIVLSGEFTASETKHPNIRHRQIREAIDLGRTFNPRIFKVSPNFERDTQACNGGRIRQECDGRWWAWANGGITGQPFPYENLAIQYLDRIAASKQAQKQISCIN